jgi:hypothetical protein
VGSTAHGEILREQVKLKLRFHLEAQVANRDRQSLALEIDQIIAVDSLFGDPDCTDLTSFLGF